MTTSSRPGGSRRPPVPGRTAPDSRPTAVLRVVVATVLVALAGLALLALAPLLAGFSGHVVVSGSMEPRISPGDVVLTRPVSPGELQPGQVLLFPDPEGGDRLLLHRLVSFDERGDLVTRGDANQSNDSTPVPAASVIGRAQLRVPHVGLPAYWRFTGQWDHLGLLAASLSAATVFTVGARRGEGAGRRGATTADRLGAPSDTDHVVRRTGLPPVPPAARYRADPRDRTPLVAGGPGR